MKTTNKLLLSLSLATTLLIPGMAFGSSDPGSIAAQSIDLSKAKSFRAELGFNADDAYIKGLEKVEKFTERKNNLAYRFRMKNLQI